MKKVGNYVIVYDVSSDKERACVDKTLKGFGFRVQKSVFECLMTKTTKGILCEKLEKLNLATGFVKIFKEEHATKSITIGKNNYKDFDSMSIYIV